MFEALALIVFVIANGTGVTLGNGITILPLLVAGVALVLPGLTRLRAGFVAALLVEAFLPAIASMGLFLIPQALVMIVVAVRWKDARRVDP